jgi:hypothetical protein
MPEQIWQVELAFTEDGSHTRAEASLEFAGHRFQTVGRARRAPEDPSVPVVGEELAAARALSELSHELLQAATARIEAWEGRPVRTREA